MLVSGARRALESRDFTIGEQMLSQHGLKRHHPVVLIPGIVSTGLESWSTEQVARSLFRKRLWVSLWRKVRYTVINMAPEGDCNDDQGRLYMVKNVISLMGLARQSSPISEIARRAEYMGP